MLLLGAKGTWRSISTAVDDFGVSCVGQRTEPGACPHECGPVSDELVDNALLEKIEGVPSLRTVGGSLVLSEHPVLHKLFDLYQLDRVGADLRVERNPLLPASAVDDLVQAIGADDIGGTVTNTGNLTE